MECTEKKKGDLFFFFFPDPLLVSSIKKKWEKEKLCNSLGHKITEPFPAPLYLDTVNLSFLRLRQALNQIPLPCSNEWTGF